MNVLGKISFFLGKIFFFRIIWCLLKKFKKWMLEILTRKARANWENDVRQNLVSGVLKYSGNHPERMFFILRISWKLRGKEHVSQQLQKIKRYIDSHELDIDVHHIAESVLTEICTGEDKDLSEMAFDVVKILDTNVRFNIIQNLIGQQNKHRIIAEIINQCTDLIQKNELTNNQKETLEMFITLHADNKHDEIMLAVSRGMKVIAQKDHILILIGSIIMSGDDTEKKTSS